MKKIFATLIILGLTSFTFAAEEANTTTETKVEKKIKHHKKAKKTHKSKKTKKLKKMQADTNTSK